MDPLVVLVHGAWHGAWCWAGLQAELDARAVASLAVDLPGHGTSTEPASDLHGDADHLARVLDTIDGRDPGRQVVLVGHSYGGAVISQAARGRSDVAQLVYVAAFALNADESVMGLLGTLDQRRVALGTAIVPAADGTTSTVTPDGARASFYGSCPEPAIEAAIARLCPQPMATMTQATTGSALGSTPSTYVLCSQDEAVHPDHQAAMAERCDRRVDIDTDHSPFVSAIGALADVIAVVAADAASGAAAS